VKFVRSTINGKAIMECKCECGKIISVIGSCLISGHTNSCGCLKGKNSFKHGYGTNRTLTYNTWRAMKDRCAYKGNSGYYLYGAIGVTVCERWKNNFINFLNDVGERPSKNIH